MCCYGIQIYENYLWKCTYGYNSLVKYEIVPYVSLFITIFAQSSVVGFIQMLRVFQRRTTNCMYCEYYHHFSAIILYTITDREIPMHLYTMYFSPYKLMTDIYCLKLLVVINYKTWHMLCAYSRNKKYAQQYTGIERQSTTIQPRVYNNSKLFIKS